MASNQCFTCEKNTAKCNCTGCRKFFCIKDFNDHRQQLSVQFDHEIVRPHDELLELLNNAQQLSNSFDQHFSQINRWENTTIRKIQEAAETARQQLIQLVASEKETLEKQLPTLTDEIRRRLNDDDFDENDIERLQDTINRLRQLLEEQTRANETKIIVIPNDEIDWNRLISVEKKGQWKHRPEVPSVAKSRRAG